MPPNIESVALMELRMIAYSRGARQQRHVGAGSLAANGTSAARVIRGQTAADAIRPKDCVALWCDRLTLWLFFFGMQACSVHSMVYVYRMLA